jgi:voltage-gated potassium channel
LNNKLIEIVSILILALNKKGENMNRARVWELINADKKNDKLSKVLDIFILTLIILNTLAVVLGTISGIEKKYSTFLYIFEVFSVVIFTIEYLVRIIFCTEVKKYKKPFLGRLKFAITPLALIDLIAILPFYLPFFSYDLRFIRILRTFRMLRILKIERYISAANVIKKVLNRKKTDLLVVFSLFSMTIFISSLIIFYVENPVQPKVFTTLLKSLWWSISSVTNLYNSDVPITFVGKVISSIISILGILLIALTTSILTSGFTQVFLDRNKKKECPKCGETF